MKVHTYKATVRTSRRIQAVDITDQIVEAGVGGSGISDGIVVITTPHTTASLFVNENESGLVSDVERTAEDLFFGRSYRHDVIDDNAAAHVCTALMGASVVLNVTGGRLELGTWQRLFLLEMDGPRSRTVTVRVLGE